MSARRSSVFASGFFGQMIEQLLFEIVADEFMQMPEPSAYR
jgi:hypothetical protein